MARDDLPPTILPVHQIPHPLAIPLQQVSLEATAAVEEEIGSSRLSLEEEIDRFRFEEKEIAPEKPVKLSDYETESNRLSSARLPKLVIARIDSSSEEMEGSDQKKRSSLKGLIANRNKGGTSKDVPKIQTPTILPPPPPPTTDLRLLANPNLKKKMPGQELEEGEVALRKVPNNKRQSRTLGTKGPLRWTVGMRLRYAGSSVPGLLGLSWKELPFLGMLLFGSPNEGMPTILLKS